MQGHDESSARRAASSRRPRGEAEPTTTLSTTNDNGHRPTTTSTHADGRAMTRIRRLLPMLTPAPAAQPIPTRMRPRLTELENASRRADAKSQRCSNDAEPRTDARVRVDLSTRRSCLQFLDRVHRARSRIHLIVRPNDLCHMEFLCLMHLRALRMISHHPSVRPVRAQEETLRSMRCHLDLVERSRTVRACIES